VSIEPEAQKGTLKQDSAQKDADVLDPAQKDADMLEPARKDADLLEPARKADVLDSAQKDADVLEPARKDPDLLEPARKGAVSLDPEAQRGIGKGSKLQLRSRKSGIHGCTPVCTSTATVMGVAVMILRFGT